MDNYIMHYGIKRKSGRYPWGSGENPYQHDGGFYSMVRGLEKEGLSSKEIAEQLGISTTQLRARYSLSKDAFKAGEISRALQLHDKGYSNTEIGKMMGYPESTIRNYLDPAMKERVNKTAEIANKLAEEIDKKKYLDVGKGVEYQLGISDTKLKTAVAMLEDMGYKKQYLKIPQATNPGKFTWVQVMTKDDVDWKTLNANRDQISSVVDIYSNDGGKTLNGLKKPTSVSSDRIKIRYAEEGGTEKDGLIEIRPGAEGLYMGNRRYAQVRIAVDDTHYLKGMAVINNDLPKGTDIIFNTNKSKGTPALGEKTNTVLKPLKDNKENPFESTVRQIEYTDKDGNKKLSAINIVNDDEDWSKWSKTLSSQMLSKQRKELVKQQLDVTYKNRLAEFEDYKTAVNPEVKKKLLYSFAEDCDAAAVHLKAAHLPRQANQVLLPINSLKENEIFAPKFNNGEEVVLIRHPHAGTFEIPRLRVNNNNREAKKFIGTDARNAVGINHIVAKQLSGADFDGDTVLVIPTKNQNIKTSRPIKELIDFDPSERYKAYPGMPEVSKKTGFRRDVEMGRVSNLITDMTVQGASLGELISADKHSMVVIDAEKHNLNWRQSEIDNNIAALKEKYQGGKNRGASTIISKAKSTDYVPVRGTKWGGRDTYNIDPKTGKKIYEEIKDTYYINKKGETVTRTFASTKMFEADDARTLMSDAKTPIEVLYADYANKMKALGNEARKEYIKTQSTVYDSSAKKVYEAEVDSLNKKLNVAKKHAPQERKAQIVTNYIMEAKVKANPELKDDRAAYKKETAQVLAEQRRRTGGEKSRIEISEKEWEAITSGAISSTKIKEILDNTNLDVVKKMAVPRNSNGLTTSELSRAKSLLANGYTYAEVSNQLGVSVSTLEKAIK